MVWERLGEDVGELTGGVNVNELHLLALDQFMGEVLADINRCAWLARVPRLG